MQNGLPPIGQAVADVEGAAGYGVPRTLRAAKARPTPSRMSTVPTTPQTVPSWLPAMRVGALPPRTGVAVAVGVPGVTVGGGTRVVVAVAVAVSPGAGVPVAVASVSAVAVAVAGRAVRV